MKHRRVHYRIFKDGDDIVAEIEWPEGSIESKDFSLEGQWNSDVRRRANTWAVDTIDDYLNAVERSSR